MNKDTVASFLIAIAGFVLVSFLWPIYGDMKDNKTLRDDKQQQLAIKQTGQQRITALAKEYQENKDKVDRLSVFLPDQKRVEYTITSLSEAAENSNIRLKSLELGEPEKGDASLYNIVEVELVMDGDFNGLLQYLGQLEQSLRLYDVVSIDISPNTVDGPPLTIGIILNTYTVQEPNTK